MSAHTPGPWWVTDHGVRDSGGQICATNKAFNYPDQDERYAQEVHERSANALLIAAAPELLEALQSLIDMDVAYQRGQKVYDAVDKALAAISKATGAE